MLSLSLSRSRLAAARLFTTSRAARLAEHYTKQEQPAGDMVVNHNGTRAYVVSTPPHPADAQFDVPPGPFQTTQGSLAPETGPAASAPQQRPYSSSSASPAHPTTTRQAMEGTLADRNPAPAAKDGVKGLGAWADRK
ncbi:hypothetical protein EXIGLDRAFT_720216 [Exidia glandulosa HHB12029]|uniref:Uncharacterized protein n=1 Tax=Exidia glandulosa HHB12029 TaxID=1314781 RepID=A0A165GJI9_EXIGL|nr:hypothetical protein EXIGLDRAFT_720216 [Exidia glandulosa HHB12029]